MTDQATISSLVQAAGRPLPSAIRSRSEPSLVPAPQGDGRPGAPDKPADPVTASRRPLLAGDTQIAAQEEPPQEEAPSEGSSSDAAPRTPGGTEALTEEEKKKVQELQRRDREVRAHEAAHKLAGGPHAGHPTFKTVKGPDGRSYAISGEVKIDTSEVPNNPDATIRKLETVKRAALAPSNPSAQDRQVAAEAESKIQKARQEKREKQAEELKEANKAGDRAGPGPEGTQPATGPNPPTPGTASSDKARSPGTLFNLVA